MYNERYTVNQVSARRTIEQELLHPAEKLSMTVQKCKQMLQETFIIHVFTILNAPSPCLADDPGTTILSSKLTSISSKCSIFAIKT